MLLLADKALTTTLVCIAIWLIFFPAVFLSITVLAVNLLGDGLRDALDPRLARKL